MRATSCWANDNIQAGLHTVPTRCNTLDVRSHNCIARCHSSASSVSLHTVRPLMEHCSVSAGLSLCCFLPVLFPTCWTRTSFNNSSLAMASRPSPSRIGKSLAAPLIFPTSLASRVGHFSMLTDSLLLMARMLFLPRPCYLLRFRLVQRVVIMVVIVIVVSTLI